MFLKKIRPYWLWEVLLITIVSAVVYLPLAGRLSFHSDDWYFIYNGLVNGPKTFIQLTLHTRPIRGPLYEALFGLFGLNALLYILTLYLWRLISGLAGLWLFHLLWPKQRSMNFFLALLFTIYPGFLWWVSGFEFQPYVISLVLQVFSIIFTLKAVGSERWWKWGLWSLAAFLSGWAYLALVEFAVGMEAFRIIAVFLFLKRGQPMIGFWQLALRTMRSSALFLLIPGAFIYWYQFIFDNWRKAQEAGLQIGKVLENPLEIIAWIVSLFQGLVNVIFGAWIVPLNGNFYSGTPREYIMQFGAGALVVGLGALAFLKLGKDEGEPTHGTELLWVGILGTAAGVVPVIIANRTVTFQFSQYALPASLAGVLFLGGLIYSIRTSSLRLVALSILLGLATLSHQAIANQAANEERAVLDFWWQVSWRAPSIRTGATLLAQYPFTISDTDSLVWGPANFIYHPQTQNHSPVILPLSGITLQPETIKNIWLGGTTDKINRIVTNTAYHFDYSNVLMMTQGSSEACMRMLNPDWLEYSLNDDNLMLAVAQYARLDSIDTQAIPSTPPSVIFGTEPVHSWCYSYQKADLARQTGNWQEIARIGNEARKNNLSPQDVVEWLPFVQAYAYTGDTASLVYLAKLIKVEPFYQMQACKNLKKMNASGYPLRPDVMIVVEHLFCKG